MEETAPARVRDRLQQLRGLLLGGAVGDALGAPVEFMSRAEILARFGPDGITRFAPAYGRLGAITDDTQMTLFTLEGLIRAEVRGTLKGICNPVSVVGHAYSRWFATQNGARSARDENGHELDGWLIGVPALWSRRAPGMTCLSALKSKAHFADVARNDSKGAGGIMRVGPIGVVDARHPYGLAHDCAALTHGHVTGQAAAGWFASWIHRVAHGEPFREAAETARADTRRESEELFTALETALRLAMLGRQPVVPHELGEGWVAEEAAAIALWCALVEPNPMKAVMLAVNIDGDSDTTGTLVGQVMGAAYGSEWIPRPMLDQLELREEMEALAADADALFNRVLDLEGLAGQAFWNRYPGW